MIGDSVRARDLEDKYRKGTIVDEQTVLTIGSCWVTFYRIKFLHGGSRWVRQHEMRAA